MKLDDFHFKIGQTIMYCQVIEHDVKRIYAAMHVGDFYENLDKIEKWSLGQTVQKLKELDFSGKSHYISASDYNFLKQMTEKRNHWCHQTYQTFLYNKQLINNFYKVKSMRTSAVNWNAIMNDYQVFATH